MFERNIDYPIAIASYDSTGVEAAIQWSLEHMQDGDTLNVWTSSKSNLSNSGQLQEMVSQYTDVSHVTGRQARHSISRGPLIMAWADMEDIAEAVGPRAIRSLCVIAWDEDRIKPWVAFSKPSVLGDVTPWELLDLHIDPIVEEALRSLTVTVNHNNTISAGFEKDQVVGVLLALHDAGIPLDSEVIQGWIIANGWSGENPKRLAKYVEDINAGKRPRLKSPIQPGYVERLRQRVAAR